MRQVQTPSGEEWRVGLRWSARRRPRLRRTRLGDGQLPEMIPTPGDAYDLEASVVIVVGALVLALVVLPLLLFGIELILLGLTIAGGILARGLLGRPWVVQARCRDDRPALLWKAHGLRCSSRTIEEVAGALAAGLEPSPSEAERVVLG